MADATATTGAKSAPIQSGAIATAILICFLVAVLEGFDIQAIGLVGPKIGEATGLSKADLGLVFSMSNIGLVPGAALGGYMADRIGRKPVFMFAVIIFGVFTLATSAITTFYPLLLVRFLTGFGFGAAIPNIMAISAEISAPNRRASTATMMFCGMPLGGACSAIFFANLPPTADWRLIFYVGGTLPLLLAAVIWFGLPETSGGQKKSEGRTSYGEALFGGGRTASTILVWLTLFPTLAILYLLLNWLPSLAADKGLAKPVEVFLGSLKIGVNPSFTFNLASVAGALILGQVIDRVGFRWPTIFCFAGLLAALTGLAQATQIEPMLIFAGISGFFILGAGYALYGIAATFYPSVIRGIGSGAATAIGRCGAIVGPWVAGELLQQGFSAEQTIMALAPAAAVAGIAVFLLSFQKQAAD